jgi:hypothetical protein
MVAWSCKEVQLHINKVKRVRHRNTWPLPTRCCCSLSDTRLFMLQQISQEQLLSQPLTEGRVYRVEYDYNRMSDFTQLARKLGIMDDWKVGWGKK